MDILSALKSEASKLQKQLNSINSAIEILGGKKSVGRGNKRHVSASERGQDVECTEGAVGEGESRRASKIRRNATASRSI